MNLRRSAPWLASTALLATGGFAAASIASGGGLRFVSATGTTGLTGTAPLGARVTICHHTHSKKHPFHTITISRSALPAHLRHGDTVGPCPAAPTRTGASTTSQHGHGNGNGNASQNQGNGKGNGDHGNGNGHGEGHGHGHP